ncbi:MAG: hypothetical protein LBD80_03695, partial [Tannerella sp.]|nr:hypothetical protein [Tannerella sp.]
PSVEPAYSLLYPDCVINTTPQPYADNNQSVTTNTQNHHAAGNGDNCSSCACNSACGELKTRNP